MKERVDPGGPLRKPPSHRRGEGTLSALTRVFGVASCFGRPATEAEPPPSCEAALQGDPAAAADDAPSAAATADSAAASGGKRRAWTVEATTVGSSSEAAAAADSDSPAAAAAGGEAAAALNDTEVNDALVRALLGLADGGGESAWAGCGAGWTGCHWETVCVTDGVTVYRARPPPPAHHPSFLLLPTPDKHLWVSRPRPAEGGGVVPRRGGFERYTRGAAVARYKGRRRSAVQWAPP